MSFNLNFANQFAKLREAKSRPSNLWSGDDEARRIVEQLNRDAGYEPVRMYLRPRICLTRVR